MNKKFLYKGIVAIVAIIALVLMSNAGKLGNLTDDYSLQGYSVYTNLREKPYYFQYPEVPFDTLRGVQDPNFPDIGVIDIQIDKVNLGGVQQRSSVLRKFLVTPIIRNVGAKPVNTEPYKGGHKFLRVSVYVDNKKVIDDFPSIQIEPGQSIALPYTFDSRMYTKFDEPLKNIKKKVKVQISMDKNTFEDFNPQNNVLEKVLQFY